MEFIWGIAALVLVGVLVLAFRSNGTTPEGVTVAVPETERLTEQQKKWKDAAEKSRVRRQTVLEEATAKAPEVFAGYKQRGEAYSAAYAFECMRAGEFLIVHWTCNERRHSHAINLTIVREVVLTRGRAPTIDGGSVIYNKHTWDFASASRDYFGYGSFWEDAIHGFPSDAVPAEVAFKGSDFTLVVPQSLGDEVYSMILDRIEHPAP